MMLVGQFARWPIIYHRRNLQLVKRWFSSPEGTQREQELKMIGAREIVGYGSCGKPVYGDHPALPFPAIRFKENSPRIMALRGKERGDWRKLSIEEKKELYRASFCQTYAEFLAPTGEWKVTMAVTVLLCCVGIWLFLFQRYLVEGELPESFTPKAQRAQLRRQIDFHIDPIRGIASKWNYETMDWKTPSRRLPPNPFINPKTKHKMERSEIVYRH